MKSATTKQGKPRRRVGHNAPVSERIALHTRRDANGCWIWTAAKGNTGYGRIFFDGKLRYAHRVAYEALVGPIPDGLQIDHLCRVRLCCNPEHLEPVTPLINVRRAPNHHGSKARCPHGHAYTAENTYMNSGRRTCRTCRLAYMRLYNAMTFEEQMARKRAGLPVVDLAAYFANESQERAA